MTDVETIDRRFQEAAIFDSIEAASFSFAFEVEYSGAERKAFRLDEISRKMSEWKNGHKRTVFRRLVQPVRSFLDDVTMGPAGSNGRPLLFAASGDAPDAESRRLWIQRDATWTYEFEDEVTELRVADPLRTCELRLRDSFCAFESGHLFYILTITHPSQGEAVAAQPLDEYAVIQLQQLAIDPERYAADAGYIGFGKTPDAAMSLVALAEEQLATLEAGTLGRANGVTDILHVFGLLPKGGRAKLTWKSLRRLCIGLESEALVDTAERVHRRFSPDERHLPVAPPKPASDCDARWLTKFRGEVSADPPPHDDKENGFDRSMLAFAGMTQGVPDFPYQDESEVHDSTRPAAFSVESWLYVHPRFVIEIAKSWRSFNRARPEIGTCPYLLLMFLVALHDELLVTEMERDVNRMLYADGTSGEHGTLTEPMKQVRDVLDNARNIFSSDNDILARNLAARLEVFRWSSVGRAGNIFRYPKERGALLAIQQAMGTDARFARVHETIDRMEQLVEDVVTIRTSYAARRTSILVFILTLLGALSVVNDVHEFFVGIGENPVPPILLGIAVIVVLSWLAIDRRRRHDKRSRKLSHPN